MLLQLVSRAADRSGGATPALAALAAQQQQVSRRQSIIAQDSVRRHMGLKQALHHTAVLLLDWLLYAKAAMLLCVVEGEGALSRQLHSVLLVTPAQLMVVFY